MSLVDYSSDDDGDGDDAEADLEAADKRKQADREQVGAARFLPTPSSSSSSSTSVSLESSQTLTDLNSGSSSVGTTIKLPNASELLASFGPVGDSMMLNCSVNTSTLGKKRHDDGMASTPHHKIQKSSVLPTARVTPDIGGGSLLPPQLRGRSNIATEDLDKLFTRKQKTNS